ncbi:hypothetical protein ADK64_30425 [Streptomyces sp. MMG1121]|nr:hypothetical protein ADK64_30425 [Streptomyces sp. MMG1121]
MPQAPEWTLGVVQPRGLPPSAAAAEPGVARATVRAAAVGTRVSASPAVMTGRGFYDHHREG